MRTEQIGGVNGRKNFINYVFVVESAKAANARRWVKLRKTPSRKLR